MAAHADFWLVATKVTSVVAPTSAEVVGAIAQVEGTRHGSKPS